MDPNATWEMILLAHRSEEWEACQDACSDLYAWMQNGGFPPRITGIELFDKLMAQTVCTNYFGWMETAHEMEDQYHGD